MADPFLVYSKEFGDNTTATAHTYLIPDDNPADAPTFTLADNDVLLLRGAYAAVTTTTSKTSGPAGVTKKNGNADLFNNGTASNTAFFYAGKLVRTTDKNTNLVITTSTSRFVQAILEIWRGVDPDADLDAVGFTKAFAGSGTAVTTPATTVVRNNSIESQFVCQSHPTAYAAPDASWSAPAGVTLVKQGGTGGTSGQSIAASGYKPTAQAAGTSITGTAWTAPLSDAWISMTVLLPPLPTGINHVGIVETTSVTPVGGTVSAVLTDNSDATYAAVDSGGALGPWYQAEKPALGTPVTWKGRLQKKTGTTTSTVVATLYAHGDRTTVLATAPSVTITATEAGGTWQDVSLVFPSSSTDSITTSQFANIDVVFVPTAS